MDTKEARLKALSAAWSVEWAISKLDWPRRFLDAADKPVVVLKMLCGDVEIGSISTEPLFERWDECSVAEHANRMVEALACAYWTLDDAKANKGDEMALSALDEAIETLCYESDTDYDYNDFLYGEIGDELKEKVDDETGNA